MAHDVTQWLAEIKLLQRQLIEMRQERDEAYNSAANWRRLYETEAQQRRIETKRLEQTIQDLRTELAHLQDPAIARNSYLVDQRSSLAEDIQQFDEADLREKLLEVMTERDRLLQTLMAERAEHQQTRQNLTTALGDAVDRLTRERADGQKREE